ncbi:hypothetical protein DCAR_0102946 [Daucus carota subsp. sativus]|uniref:Uncharacterized protein n=1 Tax=Daucus carota subsp. sativus TaxID=79200 RepID=A0A162B591_DAUCS|nr:hypothetical protein DCAR_0102946 [Daucus carota subsp. sativus]
MKYNLRSAYCKILLQAAALSHILKIAYYCAEAQRFILVARTKEVLGTHRT